MGRRNPVRIYIITIIYNRRITQIRSLEEFQIMLHRHPEISLIIADNSTDEQILELNRQESEQNGWLRYLECGGNVGLSRAYNLVLSSIRDNGPYWVMLSDDDTYFSTDYLENGYRQVFHETRLAADTKYRRKPLRMLCGVVLTDSGWISPRSEKTKEFALSFLLKQPKPGIYKNLYPINSGLFLEEKLIRDVGGFDERLFLDQVDYLMMDRIRAAGTSRIGVLPGEIRQSFSGDLERKDAGEDLKSVESRWKTFRKDFETYCALTKKPWYYRMYLLNRRRAVMRLVRFLRGTGQAGICKEEWRQESCLEKGRQEDSCKPEKPRQPGSVSTKR